MRTLNFTWINLRKLNFSNSILTKITETAATRWHHILTPKCVNWPMRRRWFCGLQPDTSRSCKTMDTGTVSHGAPVYSTAYAGTKLHCLVTEANVCVNNLSKVARDSAAAGIEPAISSRKSNSITIKLHLVLNADLIERLSFMQQRTACTENTQYNKSYCTRGTQTRRTCTKFTEFFWGAYRLKKLQLTRDPLPRKRNSPTVCG